MAYCAWLINICERKEEGRERPEGRKDAILPVQATSFYSAEYFFYCLYHLFCPFPTPCLLFSSKTWAVSKIFFSRLLVACFVETSVLSFLLLLCLSNYIYLDNSSSYGSTGIMWVKSFELEISPSSPLGTVKGTEPRVHGFFPSPNTCKNVWWGKNTTKLYTHGFVAITITYTQWVLRQPGSMLEGLMYDLIWSSCKLHEKDYLLFHSGAYNASHLCLDPGILNSSYSCKLFWWTRIVVPVIIVLRWNKIGRYILKPEPLFSDSKHWINF